MKKDLRSVEDGIRNYPQMEFGETRFAEKMLNTFLMLAHRQADGMSPSALTHLLHRYVVYFKGIRKR